MFRKLTLAFVAAASLGAVTFASTAASAHPGWGGWGGYHHFGHGFGIGFVGAPSYDGCYVIRRVPTPFGYRLRTINVCDY